ncbi:hypothetical protein [Phenylobacterium sp.]|uniref:hypothetical protein n=1 Tax=Phenylobacterium sp. TaxID=1871053 RepID=UPI00356152E8
MSLRRSVLIAFIALVAASTAAAGPAPLTAEGWGKLRIGMRERDAVRLFHLKVSRNDGVSSDECREDAWPGHPGIWVMAQQGRVTRISVTADGPRTDKHVGVGSREADIARAYGPALIVSEHSYEEAPAHYLTAWAVKGRRGVRFETDRLGKVTAFHVGDRSIEDIEGCL